MPATVVVGTVIDPELSNQVRVTVVATGLGLTELDGELETPSRANRAADFAQIRAWRVTLASIPLSHATLVERLQLALELGDVTAHQWLEVGVGASCGEALVFAHLRRDIER